MTVPTAASAAPDSRHATKSARPCPICGSIDAERLFTPKTSPGPVVRCVSCQLVFVSPLEDQHALIVEGPVLGGLPQRLRTSLSIAEFGECWEFALLPRKLEEERALRLNADAALDRISGFVNPPGRLLDFGCGWGFFLGAAANRGWQPYGIEPLPAHAAYARSAFGATVVNDTLRDDMFPAESFDVITAFQVFEHLTDPAKDLDRLFKLLRPGGVIMVEVPNFDTWGVKLLGKRHRHFVPDHVTFFSKSTLQRLLKIAGCEIVGVFAPARRMSVRHLVNVWLDRYLPSTVVSLLGRAARRLSIWDVVFSVNLGDIISVVGRRPRFQVSVPR